MTLTAALVLVMVLNTASTTTEARSAPMSPEDCLAAELAVWALPAETVAHDAEGRAIPAVDAYCSADL